VRLIPLLLATLALSACGSAAEQRSAPGSSGQSGEGSVPVETTAPTVAPSGDVELEPPPILLVSETGKQTAARGSYCVDDVNEETGQGSGVCADAAAPTYPKAITAVGPGDPVAFVLHNAAFKPQSVVTIRPLGCTDQETRQLSLKPRTGLHTWSVDLEPGAYQLDVFARFEAADGRSGDVSGSLGLTVAGAKENDALGVHDLKPSLAVCPFPD
jgi:hypothetical protein